MAKRFANGITGHCKDRTDMSELRTCSPDSEVIPNLTTRRNDPRAFNDKAYYSEDGIEQEIDQYGEYLPAGQILFFGGTLSTEVPISRTLSTTYCLAIAQYHANKSRILQNQTNNFDPNSLEGGEIWVLRVAKDDQIKSFGYPMQDVTDRKFGSHPPDEFEVLLKSGFNVNPVSSLKENTNYRIHIADLSLD